MEHWGACLEIKAVQAQQRIISGIAAGIGNTDRVQDVIVPGAFTKTLATKTPADVAVFIGHKQDSLPVGIPLVIQEVPGGLYTETLIKPGPAGDDLLATAEFLQRHGRSLGLSIGYRVPPGGAAFQRGPDGKTLRHLTEIDLFEYSYAASQSIANPKALVTGVKAGGGMYHIEKQGDAYVVVDDSGEVESRHPSRAEAVAAMRKLMANGDEPETPANRGKVADDDGGEHKATWDTAYVNNLPDSAFLFVEAGEKDGENKTVPRTKRHFPYKDAEGKVDAPHLRNAIARIPQADVPGLHKDALQGRARRMLAHLDSGSKIAEAEAAPDGAVPCLWGGAYALLDAADQITAEHKAMVLLGDDTKAGQRIRGEMRAKLREISKAIADIAEWAEYVDAERDGAAKVAHYRRQLALMDLAS